MQTHPMWNRPRVGRAGAACALLLAGSASSVARAELGDGIDMGPGRLKLGVDLNLRYDTAGGTAVNSAGQNAGDLIGLAAGKFQLSIKSGRVALDFVGDVNWNQYFGVNDKPGQNPPSSALSFVGAYANGSLEFNKGHEWGLQASEYLLRTNASANPIFGLAVLALDNTTSLRLRFTPDMGKWDFGLTGDFGAGAYQAQFPTNAAVALSASCIASPSCNPGDVPQYNSLAFHGTLDAVWHLMPKLGFIFDVGAGYQEYPVVSAANVNATPVKVDVGIGSLPATRFSLIAKVGYGGIFLANNTSTNDVTGLLDLGYQFTSTFSAHISGSRTLTPVAGPDEFYLDDHFYVQGLLKATSYLSFSLLGTADLYEFLANANNPASTIEAYGANLAGDWALNNWLHVVAGALFSARVNSGATTGVASLLQNYNRFIANVGVTSYF